MAKIKIVEKYQGKALMRLNDDPWQKLIKLEQGTFVENQNIITFKTSEGLSVTADKTSIYEEDDQKISYWGNMNEIGGPQILVDKLKEKKYFYVLRSFYPGSFLVVLTTDSNYQAPPELPFEIDKIQFLSDDHIRYQNRQIVVTSSSDSQGHNKGANRGIQIELNLNGGEGYTVTIFNMNGNHPLWGNNVQMAPKQMKIVSVEKQKIVLRGFGQDAMGSSFVDYGLSIYHNGTEPTKIKLHMYDRNIDIEYFKSNKEVKKEPEIVNLAKKAATQFQNENLSETRKYLIKIYHSLKHNPEQLKDVSNYEILGKAFYLMISLELSDDIDVLEIMINLGYLCVSKAIMSDKENANLYKDRLLLLRIGHKPFKYTVISAFNLYADGPLSLSFQTAHLKARDVIYKMEISDLELNPILYQQMDLFRQRIAEFNEMIDDEFFLPDRTKGEIVNKGIENHRILFNYLENQVINEGNIDF